MPEHTFNPAYLSRAPEVQADYEQHMRGRAELERMFGARICDLCKKIKTGRGRINIPDLTDRVSDIVNGEVGLFTNDFPYRMINGSEVLQHHLLMPLDHSVGIKNLSPSARAAWHTVLEEIPETDHYSYNFTQLPNGVHSSIPDHLHTHFVKFTGDSRLEAMHYDRQAGVAEVQFSPKHK